MRVGFEVGNSKIFSLSQYGVGKNYGSLSLHVCAGTGNGKEIEKAEKTAMEWNFGVGRGN